MHKLVPLAALIATASVASGCTQAAKAADPKQVENSIRAQEAQWQKDYAAKDVNALAGHYADDGAIVGPGDPIVSTDVDRRKALQAFVSDPNLKIDFAADQVQVAQAGDLAYSRGRYSMTMTDKATDKPVTRDGTYLTVYRKQSDGSWKAVEDFSTPGPAAVAAAK